MAVQSLTVLMVAEKPSISHALSQALCPMGTQVLKRRGKSPVSPVYEYSDQFLGMPALFKVTSTTGHIYSLDFSKAYNNWEQHSPDELFSAETVRTYDPKQNIPEHIANEAKGCDILVLWLDCDREGENICFEVMGIAQPCMAALRCVYPNAFRGCVYRAHFSSLAPQDLRAAMQDLGHPNENESLSVEARQQLDLRVGVAFSRLQTMYFRKHFGRHFGKSMVTYGPCQIPTLWFCVKRHVEIEAFVPKPYWILKALMVAPDGSGKTFRAESRRGPMWNATCSQDILAQAHKGLTQIGPNPSLTVTSYRSWTSGCQRPRPLNTVEMLKMASEVLGLGPHDALHSAEQLYLKGILSYPRTETEKYPENFDLEGTLHNLADSSMPWSAEAQRLCSTGITPPRTDGVDMGDHPPITPVKAARQGQCGSGAGWFLYEEICRHFLATISPPATLRKASASFSAGDEIFEANSSRITSAGWTEVARRTLDEEGEVDLSACLHQGATVHVQHVDLEENLTSPPRHLTESDLLALMDKHGIGTDASMATHVGNVQSRKYVEVHKATREMVPSPLGLALCLAYMLVDSELVFPSVRASIENACTQVATGLADVTTVVNGSLRIFKKKFYNVARQIDLVPLMLAVAHAQAKGNIQSVRAAAAEGLELWHAASRQILEISLDELLAKRQDCILESSPDDNVETCDFLEALSNSEAVTRVQQALDALGFGGTSEAQPKGSGGKGKRQKGKKADKGDKGDKSGKGVKGHRADSVNENGRGDPGSSQPPPNFTVSSVLANLRTMGLFQLKRECVNHGVPLVGFIKKTDLVEALESVLKQKQGTPANTESWAMTSATPAAPSALSMSMVLPPGPMDTLPQNCIVPEQDDHQASKKSGKEKAGQGRGKGKQDSLAGHQSHGNPAMRLPPGVFETTTLHQGGAAETQCQLMGKEMGMEMYTHADMWESQERSSYDREYSNVGAWQAQRDPPWDTPEPGSYYGCGGNARFQAHWSEEVDQWSPGVGAPRPPPPPPPPPFMQGQHRPPRPPPARVWSMAVPDVMGSAGDDELFGGCETSNGRQGSGSSAGCCGLQDIQRAGRPPAPQPCEPPWQDHGSGEEFRSFGSCGARVGYGGGGCRGQRGCGEVYGASCGECRRDGWSGGGGCGGCGGCSQRYDNDNDAEYGYGRAEGCDPELSRSCGGVCHGGCREGCGECCSGGFGGACGEAYGADYSAYSRSCYGKCLDDDFVFNCGGGSSIGCGGRRSELGSKSHRKGCRGRSSKGKGRCSGGGYSSYAGGCHVGQGGCEGWESFGHMKGFGGCGGCSHMFSDQGPGRGLEFEPGRQVKAQGKKEFLSTDFLHD